MEKVKTAQDNCQWCTDEEAKQTPILIMWHTFGKLLNKLLWGVCFDYYLYSSGELLSFFTFWAKLVMGKYSFAKKNKSN